MKKLSLILAAVGIGGALLALARSREPGTVPVPAPDQPVELGAVHWLRSLDPALAQSRETGKPVLILFQEVPGCSTCRNYGSDILTHPLIVEAIESLFIPVAIFNNRGGSDSETLASFREPSWNNPVVRIVDAGRKPLAERVSGDYTRPGLVNAMIAALEKSGREIPAYLSLIQQEFTANHRITDTAVFAMACFWSGESKLGALDGVVHTRPGFLQGHEVVEVTFDPKRISYDDLVTEAKSQRCTQKVFARTSEQAGIAARRVGTDAQLNTQPVRPDNQPKYYLAQTALRFVPMTPMQAARVNGALGTRSDPTRYLSPWQSELLQLAEAHPRAPWQDVVESNDLSTAWAKAQQVAEGVRGQPPSIRMSKAGDP